MSESNELESLVIDMIKFSPAEPQEIRKKGDAIKVEAAGRGKVPFGKELQIGSTNPLAELKPNSPEQEKAARRDIQNKNYRGQNDDHSDHDEQSQQ